MGKIDDVARRFDYWMKEFKHHDDTHSESFKTFITADTCIVEYGVTYNEYKELAEKLKQLGYSIEWIVPEETYDFLVEVSKKRIMDRNCC